MAGTENFESRIPISQLETLLTLGTEFGFDLTSSDEIEDYFVSLLKDCQLQGDSLRSWLHDRVSHDFRHVTSRPRWIQNPNWQMSSQGPMLFVGQLDRPRRPEVLGEACSFYVFFEP